MKKLAISVAAVVSVFPVAVSAIGFGGYYSISFPTEDYGGRDIPDIDFETSYLGITGKAWYDISRNIAIEGSTGYTKYPTEGVFLYQDYPGAFLPESFDVWRAVIGGRFGLPISFFTPYISAGIGLYHVSVTEKRFDPVVIYFDKNYPGVYVSAGTKVKLFGPVSFDISPTYSYVLATGGDGDQLERLSTFDLDFGIAVDL